MKLILTDTDNGYSWSHRNQYYLCETEEEYNALVERYKTHKNYREVEMFGRTCEVANDTQVQINVGIHCRPHTQVSDGYAVRGGRILDARGITVSHRCGTSSMDYTSYEHYIKPDSIKRNESVKSESWWV